MNYLDDVREILIAVNKDIEPYLCNDNLVTDGILDSLDILLSIAKLEDKFHVAIDPGEVLAKNFESVEAIADLVARKVDAK